MSTYDSRRAIADIPAATYDNLKVRFRDLAVVVDDVQAERLALHLEIKRRERRASLAVGFNGLSQDEKQALRGVVK